MTPTYGNPTTLNAVTQFPFKRSAYFIENALAPRANVIHQPVANEVIVKSENFFVPFGLVEMKRGRQIMHAITTAWGT